MRLHTHINFWLMNGNAPQDLTVQEIIITDVYQPLQTSALKNPGTIPNGLELEQNFPNPFNPVTTIHYSIARASKVQLSIYNVLGQKIVSLVNAHQNAGHYTVQWNGASFPSGVYLYKLKAGTFEQVKKMLLVK